MTEPSDAENNLPRCPTCGAPPGLDCRTIQGRIPTCLARQPPEARDTPLAFNKHPSHRTRFSDASSYDEVCVNCGATDIAGGGWGKLAQPCASSDTPLAEENARLKRELSDLAVRYSDAVDVFNTGFSGYEAVLRGQEQRRIFHETGVMPKKADVTPPLVDEVAKFLWEHTEMPTMASSHDAALDLIPIIRRAVLAEVAGLRDALAKVMPISVHNGPDYAEVYFADGSTHSTQAMTMNPQDWLDLQAAFDAIESGEINP